MQHRLGIRALHPERPQRHILAEPGTGEAAEGAGALHLVKRQGPKRPDPAAAGERNGGGKFGVRIIGQRVLRYRRRHPAHC